MGHAAFCTPRISRAESSFNGGSHLLEGSSSHSFLLIPHYAGSVYTDPADADSVGTDPAPEY